MQQNLHPTCNPRSKFMSIKTSIAIGDYITCAKRYGANDYMANKLYLNNNLFFANITSLM
jgi:hypothetical protein